MQSGNEAVMRFGSRNMRHNELISPFVAESGTWCFLLQLARAYRSSTVRKWSSAQRLNESVTCSFQIALGGQNEPWHIGTVASTNRAALITQPLQDSRAAHERLAAAGRAF
jgi:hypothetical protein